MNVLLEPPQIIELIRLVFLNETERVYHYIRFISSKKLDFSIYSLCLYLENHIHVKYAFYRKIPIYIFFRISLNSKSMQLCLNLESLKSLLCFKLSIEGICGPLLNPIQSSNQLTVLCCYFTPTRSYLSFA